MKSSRRIKAIVICGLVFILAVSGCAKPSAAPTSSAAPTPIPTQTATAKPTTQTATAKPPTPTATPSPTSTGSSGELKVAQSVLFRTFDPVVEARGSTQNWLIPMYDTLFGLQGMGELAPRIVEKWQMAPDGLSWTYNIRKGVKFHNGDDLTAKDVKFTIDKNVSDKMSATSGLRDAVVRTELVDDYTVRIYTKGKQPYLPYMGTFSAPTQGETLPKNYFERNGPEYFERQPVGAGPWKFVRYVPGDMLRYEAVNNHWRIVPAFKDLTLMYVPEEATRVAMLRTGAADLAEVGLDAAAQLEGAGLRVSNLDFVAAHIMFFGAYDPRASGMPITDIKVRQALSLAINREEIRKSFFHGKALPSSAPSLTLAEQDVDTEYWQKDSGGFNRYDPEKAKQLLKEAGYRGTAIKLFITPIEGGTFLPKVGEVVAGYWSKIGVNVQLAPVDRAWYLVNRPRDSNGMIGGAFANRSSSAPYPSYNLSWPFRSGGKISIVGDNNSELDRLIDQSGSETDPAKRKEMVAKAATMIANTYTLLSIGLVPSMAALGPQVDLDFPKVAPAIGAYLDLAKHKK